MHRDRVSISPSTRRSFDVRQGVYFRTSDPPPTSASALALPHVHEQRGAVVSHGSGPPREPSLVAHAESLVTARCSGGASTVAIAGAGVFSTQRPTLVLRRPPPPPSVMTLARSKSMLKYGASRGYRRASRWPRRVKKHVAIIAQVYVRPTMYEA